MSRYETLLKMKEIKRLKNLKQYKKAYSIIETLEVNRIKNISDLNIFAEIYTKNGKYEEAFDILLHIYEKSNSKRVLYQLVDLSIKRKNLEEAEQFFEEYREIVPDDDTNKLFLQYKIDRTKGVPALTLIDTLVKLKQNEYDERLAYELAKLYEKVGYINECIKECNDIILWFGNGIYVEKAKLLKRSYTGEEDITIVSNDVQMDDLTEDNLSDDNYDGIDYLNQNEKNENFYAKVVEKEDSENETMENKATQDNFIDDENNGYEDDLDMRSENSSENESYHSDGNKEVDRNEYNSDDDDMDFLRELISTNIPLDNMEGELQYSWYENETVIAQEENEFESQEENELITQGENVVIPQEDREFLNQETDMATNLTGNYLQNSKNEKQIELDSIKIKGIHLENLFKNFFLVEKIREQILANVENILYEESNSNHFIITGYEGSGKTELGKMLSRLMYKLGLLRTTGVAKISAEVLNKIDLNDYKEKLIGGSIIIEQAGLLSEKTIDDMIHFIENRQEGLTIILEDNKEDMNALVQKYPFIQKYFIYEIHLPIYEESDLNSFADEYLKKNNLQLNIEAEKTLHLYTKKIIEENDEKSRLKILMEYINDAKANAEKRFEHNLKKMIIKGVYKEDICIIESSDFMDD